MRLFHSLKDINTALKLFKDESLDGFFDQLISYQLLLDLLYENGRYQEMLDIYNVIKERQVNNFNFKKFTMLSFIFSSDSRRKISQTCFGIDICRLLQAQHTSFLRVCQKSLERTSRSWTHPDAPCDYLHGRTRPQSGPTPRRLRSHVSRQTTKLSDSSNHQSFGVCSYEAIRRCCADSEIGFGS